MPTLVYRPGAFRVVRDPNRAFPGLDAAAFAEQQLSVYAAEGGPRYLSGVGEEVALAVFEAGVYRPIVGYSALVTTDTSPSLVREVDIRTTDFALVVETAHLVALANMPAVQVAFNLAGALAYGDSRLRSVAMRNMVATPVTVELFIVVADGTV